MSGQRTRDEQTTERPQRETRSSGGHILGLKRDWLAQVWKLLISGAINQKVALNGGALGVEASEGLPLPCSEGLYGAQCSQKVGSAD